jgi:hypothetical protein
MSVKVTNIEWRNRTHNKIRACENAHGNTELDRWPKVNKCAANDAERRRAKQTTEKSADKDCLNVFGSGYRDLEECKHEISNKERVFTAIHL